MKTILLVEDDALLRETLAYNLRRAGYDTAAVPSAAAAREALSNAAYDLAVLDVNLPDGDGFRLCADIKAADSAAPVMFLTANDLERDMLRGYELGAEDYVTKPFHISVFLKKAALLLARAGNDAPGDTYSDGHLSVDFAGVTAALGGRTLTLTPMEYRTLKVFTSNAGVVLTRQRLLERLWDADENFVDEHALTAHISRIRGKIEAAGRTYIKTVYGMGYMWMGGGRG